MIRLLSRCRRVLTVSTTIMESFTTSGLTHWLDLLSARSSITRSEDELRMSSNASMLAALGRLSRAPRAYQCTRREPRRRCTPSGARVLVLASLFVLLSCQTSEESRSVRCSLMRAIMGDGE